MTATLYGRRRARNVYQGPLQLSRECLLQRLGDLVGLGADGRVLVRYSGTEAKARVMIEGADEQVCRSHADEIARVMQQSLQN